jgi:hypothetical protein
MPNAYIEALLIDCETWEGRLEKVGAAVLTIG